MKKICLAALFCIFLFGCKPSDDDTLGPLAGPGPTNVEGPRLSSLQKMDNEGNILQEVIFEYDDKKLVRTIYNDYFNIFETSTDPWYTVIDSFFYSTGGRLLMASNTDRVSQVCALDSKFIFQHNLLVRIEKEHPDVDNEPDVLFTRSGNTITGCTHTDGIGSMGTMVNVVLDNSDNIIDVVDLNDGERNPFFKGAQGINEYDTKKNPLANIDKAVRLYWSFGRPCDVLGEMEYGLGENNRVRNEYINGNVELITSFQYTYSNDNLPLTLKKTFCGRFDTSYTYFQYAYE